MDNPSTPALRPIKTTVLAYGEGEDEKIFLRHLVWLYCRRDKVSVSTSSAGGGDPTHMLHGAIRFRRGEKRDLEFILLDTDVPWPQEMKDLAEKEGFKLIGNEPCLEAFFLDILESPKPWQGAGTGRCKEFFEEHCLERNFNEDECVRLFPKSLLNTARRRNNTLDMLIKMIEGSLS